MESILLNWAIVATLVLSLIIISYLSYIYVNSFSRFETRIKNNDKYIYFCAKYSEKKVNIYIRLLYLFSLLGIILILIPFLYLIFGIISIFGLFMLIISILYEITVTYNLIFLYVLIPFVYFLCSIIRVFKSNIQGN